MQTRQFDPSRGQAFQGDVAIVPIPDDVAIATHDEIKPRDGRLILQEGEVTGHHHALDLPRTRNFRQPVTAGDPLLHVHDTRLRKALGGKRVRAAELARAIEASPQARLYRDPSAATNMASVPRRAPSGETVPILTRADLAVGCLVIEDTPMRVSHEEHDTILLLPGRYYIGRQVESVGAEERRVED